MLFRQTKIVWGQREWLSEKGGLECSRCCPRVLRGSKKKRIGRENREEKKRMKRKSHKERKAGQTASVVNAKMLVPTFHRQNLASTTKTPFHIWLPETDLSRLKGFGTSGFPCVFKASSNPLMSSTRGAMMGILLSFISAKSWGHFFSPTAARCV